MNKELREKALARRLPLMNYILEKIKAREYSTGIKSTILAACPNSVTVIRAALRAAKRANAPIKFAATLNQVDTDGGYTGLTHEQFVKTIHNEANRYNLTSPVIIALDHGGPWLKDMHRLEKWSPEKSMESVKNSFEAAINAGFDLIHVDPTIDITLPRGEIIAIDTVVTRTIELIEHAEHYRISKGLPPIAYEVGTEEVHGGLADLETFKYFLESLKGGLKEKELLHAWPCFIVGKVGTDLHTTQFDPLVARKLTEIASSYGSLIKGHYSDNVSNPEEYPRSGIGAANVGPEFTEQEYDAITELENLEKKLFFRGLVAKLSGTVENLRNAVIASGRWKKWVQKGESQDDFNSINYERQLWLIKTGCRYIWENPEVIKARYSLLNNLKTNGIDGEEIILFYIEKAMDKYLFKFNLVGLNDILIN
jgi:D-tagatose-1,6-bisphosphate aldolase subunit GatZ/KbaZ